MPTFDSNLALFQENSGNAYNAIEFRRHFQAHTNSRAGVLRSNDFACSVVGNTIVIQPGSAYIADSTGSQRGNYFARSIDDSTTAPALVIPNNGTGSPRIDIVTLRILDNAAVPPDASNNCAIVYETNTTVSAFARSLVLFQLEVTPANTYINQLDRRQFAGTYQGITRCTSGTRPTSPSEGDFAYETDTDAEIYYDGAIWKRTGDQIPHSNAIGVVSPWVTWNFTNPTGVPGSTGTHPDAAQRAAITMSFVKQRADTKLLMTLTCPAIAITFTTTANYALMEMGLRNTVTGTLYQMWRSYFNTTPPSRGTCTGVISLSGLAAGTYSYEPYLSQVAQFTIGFIDQGISFQITETL